MQQQTFTVAVIVVVTFGAGFMTGRMSVPAAPPGPAPMTAPTAATPFPGASPAPAAAPPPTMQVPPAQAPAPFGAGVSGTIAEVIQVPNFTYLRLTTPAGDEWAAISANTNVAVGQQATIGSANLMENFPSKTLNRTFERIWFGELK